MEPEELKRKLMGLWEKTTHNSKELLGVLFEYYFDTKYIEYKESEGKVVSALCGIPYTFGFGNNKLHGLYIITLSSEEGFHKRGILSELLQKFNSRMKEEFDFTFLIPHTELLADYFGTQGYFSSFFLLEERFTSLHDFRNDYLLSLNDSDERIQELKKGLIDEIRVSELISHEEAQNDLISFIVEIEKKGTSSINLCHTNKDIDYVLREDSIRHLNAFVAYDSDNKVAGVAFTQKEDMKRIRVVANYVSDPSVYHALLDYIKHQFEDYSISVNTIDPRYQDHSLIQLNYASANPAGGDLDNTFGTVEISFNITKLLQPLGMVRLLRFDRIMEYIAATRSDVDFRLFIRDYDSAGIGLEKKDENEGGKPIFVIKNGQCKIVEVEDPAHDRSIVSLSQKEVSELLLRKNDSSNLIMEAFGIPRLNLQVRLLPC